MPSEFNIATIAKLHGKRRIERRLFFQPLQVHFPCVFAGFSGFVHFLDSLKSCDKLLRLLSMLYLQVCISITSFAGRELNFDTLQPDSNLAKGSVQRLPLKSL